MTTTSPQPNTTVIGTISGVSGLAAIGTNIRQNPIFLKVEIAPGDPAALQRVAEQMRLVPNTDRVMERGRDFVRLVGRSAVVSRALESVAQRESVSIFGEDGIGKSVLLRHLAWRADAGFERGVVRLEAGGQLWQDIAQEVVWAFFEADLPVYLGPTHLRTVLRDLDALLLLDDVDTNAGIDQLYTLMEGAAFIVAGQERLLAGESRAVRLAGLEPAVAEELVAALVGDVAVESEVARRIGAALGGNPGRIIRAVEDALTRSVDLAQLAAQLEAGADRAAAAAVERLSHIDRAVVDAVAALDGAPAGPEHVAAVVPDASEATVDALEARRVLRVASPQVRLDDDIAAALRHTHDAPHPDAIRRRLLDHYVDWIARGRATARQIADESRAILALLRWAERTGRADAALALAIAAEGGLALAGRWGTWASVTDHRLRAARALGLRRDEAVALNQLGVLALAYDDPVEARSLFSGARDVALDAGADDVAATASHNIEIIDYPLAPPPDGTTSNGDVLGKVRDWIGGPWTLGGGLLVLALIVALLVFLNLDRPALAIEPASRTFSMATVESDGEQVDFTVSNTGSTTLEGLDVSLSGDAAGDFYIVGGDCPGAFLEPSRTCSVVLLFHPGQGGGGQATLTVAARDGTSVVAVVEGQSTKATIEPPASETPPQTETPPPPTDSPPPVIARPDLVIDSFRPTGAPSQPDEVLIPVEVVIGNAGDGEAGLFPIVITADGLPVPFEGAGDPSNPITGGPLDPGQRVSYTGSIRLDPATPLDQVALVVEADSCALEPDAVAECRIAESREDNNSLQLQAVDLQLSNVVLGIARPAGPVGLKLPDAFEVDIAFDIRNEGTEDAGEFWMAGFLGQLRADLHPVDLEYDTARLMPHVTGLIAGDVLSVKGTALGAASGVEQPLTIVAGCPPLADPCFIPEIALANNAATVSIPLPTPTPTPENVVD